MHLANPSNGLDLIQSSCPLQAHPAMCIRFVYVEMKISGVKQAIHTKYFLRHHLSLKTPGYWHFPMRIKSASSDTFLLICDIVQHGSMNPWSQARTHSRIRLCFEGGASLPPHSCLLASSTFVPLACRRVGSELNLICERLLPMMIHAWTNKLFANILLLWSDHPDDGLPCIPNWGAYCGNFIQIISCSY